MTTYPHVPQKDRTGKGLFIDGSVVEVNFGPTILSPEVDEHLGPYYTDIEGRRWKPLEGSRLTATHEYAGGPGWFELLDPSEEPPEGDE